jgi:hypothetical protein
MKAISINNLSRSKTTTKSFERLAFAVVLAAIRDLRCKNLARRLDAALWLINEAPLWIDFLDMKIDPALWLTSGAQLK